MLDLELHDKNFIISIEEDTTPYACGFVKGKDIFFAITIKVYIRNSKNKKGKFVTRYSKIWFEYVEESDVKNFIYSILTDIDFREEYRTSDYIWCDRFDFKKEDIFNLTNFLNNSKHLLSTKDVKSFDVGVKFNMKNTSIKLDAISLFVSDDDIDTIKKYFTDRPSILYAISLMLSGETLEYAIEATSKFMSGSL